MGAVRRLGVVAEIAGHGAADGECERAVYLGGADEHVLEHSPAGEQFLSETIVVWAGAGPFGSRNGSHDLFETFELFLLPGVPLRN
jgi:hypothetical protein